MFGQTFKTIHGFDVGKSPWYWSSLGLKCLDSDDLHVARSIDDLNLCVEFSQLHVCCFLCKKKKNHILSWLIVDSLATSLVLLLTRDLKKKQNYCNVDSLLGDTVAVSDYACHNGSVPHFDNLEKKSFN